MTIIDRYILRELTKIFLLSTFVLTGVLFLDKVLFLTGLIINKNVSLVNVVKMLLYISPAFLAITIPMGVLVAALITFSHLSAESEIIAMKATGISFPQMLRPVLYLSLTTYFFSNIIMFAALPWGNQSFRDLIFHILRSKAGTEIKEGVFYNQFKDMVLYVNKKAINDPIMQGIFISDSTTKEGQRIITAKQGILFHDNKSGNQIFQLKDGTIHQWEEKNQGYRILSFNKYSLPIDVPDPTRQGGRLMKGNREMSVGELLKKIESLKKDGKKFSMELVEFHKKFSIPFTCLILGFIGAPLGIKTARAGRSGGFAVSLIVILFYYVCLIFGESLGGTGQLPPAIAMWIPNILIMAVGCYLVNKTTKETPIVFMEKFIGWVVECAQKIKSMFVKDVGIET